MVCLRNICINTLHKGDNDDDDDDDNTIIIIIIIIIIMNNFSKGQEILRESFTCHKWLTQVQSHVFSVC